MTFQWLEFPFMAMSALTLLFLVSVGLIKLTSRKEITFNPILLITAIPPAAIGYIVMTTEELVFTAENYLMWNPENYKLLTLSLSLNIVLSAVVFGINAPKTKNPPLAEKTPPNTSLSL